MVAIDKPNIKMKTTVLIQDDNMQLELSPETEFEHDVLDKYREKFMSVEPFRGSFTDCQGGWTRGYDYGDSLMLRINDNKTDE